MSYYSCCWRFDRFLCQFTIVCNPDELTYEWMKSEHHRLFSGQGQLPFKVQIVRLTDSEGKAFEDLSEEELRNRPVSQEFQDMFAARYQENKFRFVFDEDREGEMYLNWRNRVMS